MQKLDFNRAAIWILHPDQSICKKIRAVLQAHNARPVEFFKTRDLYNAFDMDTPMGLIASVNPPMTEVLKLITKLRGNHVGTNPFLPVMALTEEAETDHLTSIINSGANIIAPGPLEKDGVFDNLVRLTQDDREYVAIEQYVGPRRLVQKHLEPLPSYGAAICAPNVLQSLVTGQPLSRSDIADSAERLIKERIKGAAFHTLSRLEKALKDQKNNSKHVASTIQELCASALSTIPMAEQPTAKQTFELTNNLATHVAAHGLAAPDRLLYMNLFEALALIVHNTPISPTDMSDLDLRVKNRLDELRS